MSEDDVRMGRASVIDSMEIGTRALAAGDWVAARDAFAVAVTEGGSTGALDGLGRAKWWLKDVSGAIEARTHAYTALRREGRFEEAARVAVWLAREHRSLYRNDAVADGWVSRARSAADRAGDCGAHGWIRVAQAEGSLDVERAVDLVRGAVSLARQHDDADLETVALARLGALEVAAGAVDFGQAPHRRGDGRSDRR